MCKLNVSAKHSLCCVQLACLIHNTCQEQHYNASVTFILTQANNEWHHDDDSGLRYADVVPEPSSQDCHDPAPDCIPAARLALACSAACSVLQSSGRPWSSPSPAPAPGTGQLCYPTLLQNVKVALRVQPPLVTEESDGFLLTQKEGESQKYKVSNCD